MSVLVPAKFPSLSAVFMAAAASILLLLVARILFLLMRVWSCPLARSASQEKEHPLALLFNPSARSLQWNVLPVSLPFNLALLEKPSPEVANRVAVALSLKRSQMLPIVNWRPRTGPQFQPPPPALYESPVPLSMAKIIMSRHTFRKPNPNRSRRTSVPSSSRPASPTPQTPSRLYHSIA